MIAVKDIFIRIVKPDLNNYNIEELPDESSDEDLPIISKSMLTGEDNTEEDIDDESDELKQIVVPVRN